MNQDEPEVLSQNYELGFSYTRSTGPVVGRFLTALKNRRLLGNRGADGTVYAPPVEYDPHTAAPVDDFVELADRGVIVSWVWVSLPQPRHPLDRPFAYALIKLDGADVPMLHLVDAPGEAALSSGMRVVARWADVTRGHITDIAWFELEQGACK